MEKRIATPEEIESILIKEMDLWNFRNTDNQRSEIFWRLELAKAEREGHISDVCSCGRVFLAYHHFVMCNHKKCPMTGRKSVLDMLCDGD